MFPTAVAILLFIGLAGFTFTAFGRIKILKLAKPSPRYDHLGRRLWLMCLYAVGQKRFFQHGRLIGLMHAFIFWGFCAVALHTVILFGQGLVPGFAAAFTASTAGHSYDVFRNIFEVLVIVGSSALLFRRLFLKTKRLTLSLEADVILLTIILLMATDFMIEWRIWPEISYFTHLVLILGFLNWLPYGKHFHILTSLPNVFFQKLEPAGAIAMLDLEDEKATSFGTGKITDLSWKQGLDLFTCTECGRCQDLCPAFATEKPLSPKQFSMDLRDHLYEVSKGRDASLTIPADGKPSKLEPPELTGNVIKADTIWSCTTCRACEEVCPVFIEYVDKMVDMRRYEVLMKGAVSKEAQTALKNMETNYNPWGIGAETRGDWASGLGVKTLREMPDAEYLYFVGCAGSFDERAKKVSTAFVKLLQKAGVSFAILGAEERCTGDSARRMGNEYLFQTLAKDNIATLSGYGVKKILTTCPHCFNTLKNEYPRLGGRYEVHHHAEFLLGLIRSKRLDLSTHALTHSRTLTYHDSCYLGRYNGIYDAPRELLELAGYKIREPEKNKELGTCCGAGGGRMWMEENIGTRINHMRFDELKRTGTEDIASACPFCLTMISDAGKEKCSPETTVRDIAEILAENV